MLLVSNDEVVASSPRNADKLVEKGVDGCQHPREDNPVNFFEFKKRVFCKHYSQSQVMPLNSESDSEGTSGLVRMYDVDFFRQKDFFGLRVVSDEVGKTDIRGGNNEIRQVVSFDSLYFFDSVVIGGITVCDNYNFSHSFLQNLTHLLYMDFHPSETGVEEIAHQSYSQIFL